MTHTRPELAFGASLPLITAAWLINASSQQIRHARLAFWVGIVAGVVCLGFMALASLWWEQAVALVLLATSVVVAIVGRRIVLAA